MNKTLIILQGPTAVGKTEIAINLALKLGTEVINADSRQIFSELKIGTARPDTDDLKGVKHHLLGHLKLEEEYNAQNFAIDARRIIAKKLLVYDQLIVSGGSGFYIESMLYNLDEIPDIPKQIRTDLNKEFLVNGLDPLLEELQNSDPQYFEKVDRSNPQRIIRALEVKRFTGKAFSSFHKNKKKAIDFPVLNIALFRDRENLIQRINQRVDNMIEMGLEEEAKRNFDKKQANALQTVGYQEFFDYFEGKVSLDNCVEKIKTNTRRFAKRQMTWLRRQNNLIWINLDLEKDAVDTIIKKLNGLA